MMRFYFYLFVSFCLIVLLVFGATFLGHAFEFDFPIINPIGGAPLSGGLSVVDFSLFARGGKGLSYITQGYGATLDSYRYIGHWHNGVDIAARYGAPVYSPIANGVVEAVGNQDNYCPREGFGRFVVVRDDTNKVMLLFAHLGIISVSTGDPISKGNELGRIGATGLETGTHLHLSIFKSPGFTMTPAHGCGPYPEGRDINPLPYLETVYQ